MTKRSLASAAIASAFLFAPGARAEIDLALGVRLAHLTLLGTDAPDLCEPGVRKSCPFIGLTGVSPAGNASSPRSTAGLARLSASSTSRSFSRRPAKERMAKLVEDLRASLRNRLNALDWMDAPTRAKALGRLEAFGVKIGCPEKWRDYRSVKIARDDYLGNVLRADAFEVSRRLARMGQLVDRSEWGMTPPTVNAYSRPTSHEIAFPAGILRPPFFDLKADDAVNYGGIGSVIGHEMTHGFDDRGSKFDAQGNSPRGGPTRVRKTSRPARRRS